MKQECHTLGCDVQCRDILDVCSGGSWSRYEVEGNTILLTPNSPTTMLRQFNDDDDDDDDNNNNMLCCDI
jgi:hypothetical protein